MRSEVCGFNSLTALPFICIMDAFFIHYANGMGGKLGNKGRRKEKIALACFNILFISKHCGPQMAEPQTAPCLGIHFYLSLMSSLRETKLVFLQLIHSFFREPSQQHNICRKQSKLRFLFFASGLSTSSILIFGKMEIENNI